MVLLNLLILVLVIVSEIELDHSTTIQLDNGTHTGTSHLNGELDKRELTSNEWNANVKKGGALLCLMRADVAGATRMLEQRGKIPASGSSQSQWTKYSDLEKYGWRKSDTNFMVDFDQSVPITKALNALDLSTVAAPQGPNEGIHWDQSVKSTVKGTVYKDRVTSMEDSDWLALDISVQKPHVWKSITPGMAPSLLGVIMARSTCCPKISTSLILHW